MVCPYDRAVPRAFKFLNENGPPNVEMDLGSEGIHRACNKMRITVSLV